MQAARFSIVTPCFNQLDWLKLCIVSVRDQVSGSKADHSSSASFQDVTVEHIIQDNCTPGIDHLAEELGAELHLNGRLIRQGHDPGTAPDSKHYTLRIYSEPDQGMYDAVNRGLQRARGDFLAFLNADDQYLAGALAKVAICFAEHPHLEMVFGDTLIVSEEGEYLCSRIVTKPTSLVTGLHTLSIFTAATFFRRILITNRHLYFDAKWRVIGDAIWILDHLKAATAMGLMRQPLAAATETGENMILSPLARQESAKLRERYSKQIRLLKPFVVAWYRLRRLVQGAYFPRPCHYSIYTSGNTVQRTHFYVGKATHRLRGRFG